MTFYLVTDTGPATEYRDARRARHDAIGCKRRGVTPAIVRADSVADAREAVAR